MPRSRGRFATTAMPATMHRKKDASAKPVKSKTVAKLVQDSHMNLKKKALEPDREEFRQLFRQVVEFGASGMKEKFVHEKTGLSATLGQKKWPYKTLKERLTLEKSKQLKKAEFEREMDIVSGSKITPSKTKRGEKKLELEEYSARLLGKRQSGLLGVGDGSHGFTSTSGRFSRGVLHVNPGLIKQVNRQTDPERRKRRK